MNSTRKSIDIFKIYQESKLNPKLGPIEEAPFHKIIKPRPKTPLMKPPIPNSSKGQRNPTKSPKIFQNKENIENPQKYALKNWEKLNKISFLKTDRSKNSSSSRNSLKPNDFFTIIKVFEEIRSLNSFMDEAKKNENSNFSNEEIFEIVRNRLKTIGNYENLIVPQKQNNIKQEINIKKSIHLISKENGKTLEHGSKTERTLNSFSDYNIKYENEQGNDKSKGNNDQKDQISFLRNKILSRKENSKSPYSRSFLD